MRAAKLYLEFVGESKKQNSTQNNYIQINGNVYNEEKLKSLKPEQLQIIETILQTAEHERPLFSDAEILE